MRRLLAKTFPRGGASIPHRKNATENKAIVEIPAPKMVSISLHQHIGAPCEPLVSVGDYVYLGQKIGEAKGFISAPVHASVSGKVVDIEEVNQFDGQKRLSVVIENDQLDRRNDNDSSHYSNLTPQAIQEAIQEAGIVGMGGAGFPTHVKVKPNKPIGAVIINGAECEPYLTCDHRLMIEKAHELISGLKALMKAVGANKGIIGVEINKADAIAILNELVAAEPAISILRLKVKYPQGAEKQLIRAAIGCEVPSGALPAEVGCIVSNVHTAIAVDEIITQGIPSYQRVITVSGSCVHDPRNIMVRIGTPLEDVINFCGGIKGTPAAIISGGPMTGKQVVDLTGPVVKNLSGILLLSEEEIIAEEDNPCFRCAKCVDSCPAGLMPNYLATYSEHEMLDELARLNIMDCIECGLCSFVCPAQRGICRRIKQGKTAMRIQNNAV